MALVVTAAPLTVGFVVTAAPLTVGLVVAAPALTVVADFTVEAPAFTVVFPGLVVIVTFPLGFVVTAWAAALVVIFDPLVVAWVTAAGFVVTVDATKGFVVNVVALVWVEPETLFSSSFVGFENALSLSVVVPSESSP